MHNYHIPPQGVETVIPPPRVPKSKNIQFSFMFYDPNHDTSKKTTFVKKYPKIFVAKLKELEDWTVEKFVHFRDKNYHIHSIDWKDTSVKYTGFNLASEYDECAWQFSISGSNKYGRVTGFLIANVFYVVWLDPEHKVYPGR